MIYNGKELKVTTKVVTYITVNIAKTCWEQLDALQKEFKDEVEKIDYAHQEYTKGGDICGFVFELLGMPINFNNRVIKALAKADAKVANDAINDEKAAKEFVAPVLSDAKNEFAAAMAKMIKDVIADGMKYLGEKDYYMARCIFGDISDFVKAFNMLNRNRFTEAAKFILHLDTSVRESIPEKIWRHLYEPADK